MGPDPGGSAEGGRPKPADPAKLKDTKQADADKDKKAEKGKQQAKGKHDTATGFDRGDQAAGGPQVVFHALVVL